MKAQLDWQTLRDVLLRVAAGAAALGVAACGVEFDPSEEVQTLRVLGVQKDKPYPAPGDEVTLSMLYTDPREDAEPVQVAWLSGCFNPAGDLYAGCFEEFAEVEDPSSGQLPEGFAFGFGDTHTFTVPDDIISSRPPPADPDQPPYGLSYVFFAACAGTLSPAPADQLATFPLACFDRDGNQLHAEDFIIGYSGLYSYDEFRNANPIITGFRVSGIDVPVDCIGTDCLTTAPNPPDCAGSNDPRCVAACSKDGEPDCPEIAIQPVIDEASAEPDDVAIETEGRNVEEQMWVRYYTDRGGFTSGVRLLNDATLGWNDEYGTAFLAPDDQGPVTIHAVAYDSRGGIEWARVTLGVR